MKELKTVETYEREFLEIHEKGHDQKWRRLTSSPSLQDHSVEECLKEVLQSAHILKGGTENLRGFLPHEFCRVGQLRLCRVKRHVEVLSFPVKLALRRINKK